MDNQSPRCHSQKTTWMSPSINICVTTNRTILGEIAEIREQAAGKREVIRELDAFDQQRRRMMTSKQEKLDKLTVQFSHKMADRHTTIEQLNK